MKVENRVNNSIRNIAWGIVLKFTVTLLPFLNRTIIIRSLGIEYTGVASLFTSILSVLSLAELGISTAILFSMYKTIADNDTERTNALLAYYRKAYYIIGTVILILGIIICINVKKFIADDIPAGLNIYTLFLLFLINTVSSYFFFSYAGIILTANQREDINHRITIAVNVIKEIGQAIMLLIFKNYYYYVFVLILMTVVHNGIVYTVTRKKYPQNIATGELSYSDKVMLRKQIVGLVIGKISVVSRNSFDSIILSAYLGLVPTAIYNNYYYVMNAVFGIVFYFASGIKASVGNKIATQSVEENYSDMLFLSYGFYIIYSSCTSCLVCAYQPAMKLWVGERLTAPLSLAVLMSLYFFLFCSVGIISQYWEAAGLFWENRFRYIIEAMSNLILNIALVRIFGMSGIIGATIVSMLFSTNIIGPYICFKHYFKGCSMRKYFKRQVLYFTTTLFFCVLSYTICLRIEGYSFIGILSRCIISGSLTLFGNIILYSRITESKKLFSLAQRILCRR